jgi:tRNA A-37 threonylcarbamoyl transferase component Bud32
MIGETISNYDITAFLGAGSQATVYEARHRVLGTTAALKVLLPQIARTDPEGAARFMDEARAAASLDDDGVVRVLDCGRDERTGCLFIVMEKVDGVTLASWLRDHRPTVEEAAALVHQLADALEAAHDHLDEHGEPAPIVHRDLKPENIFLCGPERRIKIVDFGVAKLAPAATARTTREAAVFGSPPYMAPEQLGGEDIVDHRADLYSLGCIFWELVTGAPPSGPDPGPLSRCAGVPPALDHIVGKLLAKHPDDRYQNCGELEADLDRYARTAPAATTAAASWILRRSPAGTWAIAFFIGWLLFFASIVAGVGTSYASSLNWGVNYILVAPMIVALLVRAIHDATSALRGLVDRRMIVDARGRAVSIGHPALQSWSLRLEAIPLRTAGICVITILVSLADWRSRYTEHPLAGEWWAESPTLGALGSIAQGLLVGSVLTFLTVILPYAWSVAELGGKRLGVSLRPDPSSSDAREGFEVFAPVLQACVLAAVLLWLSLYLSELQAIAIEYGRADGGAVPMWQLFRDRPLFDTGPTHISITGVAICTISILSCIAVVLYLVNRVAWSATGESRSVLPFVSPLRFTVVCVAAVAMFIVYHLGALVVLAMVIAFVVATGRALHGAR